MFKHMVDVNSYHSRVLPIVPDFSAPIALPLSVWLKFRSHDPNWMTVVIAIRSATARHSEVMRGLEREHCGEPWRKQADRLWENKAARVNEHEKPNGRRFLEIKLWGVL